MFFEVKVHRKVNINIIAFLVVSATLKKLYFLKNKHQKFYLKIIFPFIRYEYRNISVLRRVDRRKKYKNNCKLSYTIYLTHVILGKKINTIFIIDNLK